MDDRDDENVIVKLTSLGVLGVGLAALFLGYGRFWVVFVVGFAVLVPAVKILTDELGLGSATDGSSTERDSAQRDSTDPNPSHAGARADAPESKQDALDTLRDRYARGELSDSEFERKVERLLETETLEGARERVSRENHSDASRETERR